MSVAAPARATALERLQAPVLARLRDQPGRAAALSSFDDFFGERLWLQQLQADDRPAVGQLCGFFPEELVLACGLRPLRLELADSEASERGSGCLGPETCCEARALAGMVERQDPLLERLALILVPASCDAKRGLVEAVSWPAPVELLALPAAPQPASARGQWRRELERLLRVLARLGHRPNRRRLLEAAARVNRRAELVRRLNRLRRAERPPLSGADALQVMQAAALADIDWYNRHLESLLDELTARGEPAAAQPVPTRLLLAGSPLLWPDLRIPLAAAECGAQVVADDLCNASAWLERPLVFDEFDSSALVAAAAERTLGGCGCPCLLGQEPPGQRLRRLVDDYRIAGVVHHQLVACTPHAMAAARLQREFDRSRVGWLELVGQFAAEESAPLLNRLQAFCEMLRGRGQPVVPGR